MKRSANVTNQDGLLIAELSDGRLLSGENLNGMAVALFEAGVEAHEVAYRWQSGLRMISAGQQVALRAELHRLEVALVPLGKATAIT
jgi:hypothetical protein